MAECSNQRFKNMIHLYELDLLPEKDRQEFELHLFECEDCRNSLLQFESTADHLRNSRNVRALINQIAEEQSEAEEVPAKRNEAGPGHKRFWSKLLPASVITIIVLIFLLLKPWRIEIQPTQEAIAQENRLIVMLFENLTDESDSEKTGKIISNLLTTDLSESHYIQVVSSQRLYDILRLLDKQDNEAFDKNIATEIAQKAEAKWMLQGSVMQVKPRLVITVQLVDVSSGTVVMSRRVEAGSDEDMFAMVDRLTVDIKNSLSLPTAAYDEFDPAIADVTTHSQEAYQYYLEGVEYFNKLYNEEAEESYRKAIEFDSTFAIAYYSLAWISRDSTALAKAIKYSNNATRKERLYIKALEAKMSNNPSQYVENMHEIINNYPDEKEAFFDLAIHMKYYDQIEEAVKYFNKALEVDPLYKIAYNELAYLYNETGDLDRAIATANKYVELAPDEANPYDTRGEIFAMQGKLDSAIESYEKAYSIRPDFYNYSTLFDLGRLHIYKGDYDKAQDLFRYAAANGTSVIRSMARTHMALIPLYQGRFKETMEILDDGIAADRMESTDSIKSIVGSWKQYLKGRIYFELGNLQSALEDIEKASEIYHKACPDSVDAYGLVKALILAHKGDFAEAENIARKMTKKTEENELNPYVRTLARIEFIKGNYKEAIAGMSKATGRNPTDLTDKFLLGRAYLAEARPAEAIAVFENLLIDYASEWRLMESLSSVKIHYYLGQAYELSGQTEKAIEQYEKFLDIWSNSDPGIPEKDDARERLIRLESRS